MEKRYQVFVSSTYADLKDERQRVIQTLMEMDCIPTGMELFPAADEEQWKFIKQVIDDCDYYLLIIGGRYGSLTSDGISYTEKEFDYALARGIKIIALLLEPDDIPTEKLEREQAAQDKLKRFRDKVSSGRLIKHWKSAEDLPGLVAVSLQKTIKTYPAIGWVRANTVPSESLLMEINELRKENLRLKEEIQKSREFERIPINDLATLDEKIQVGGTHSGIKPWSLSITWKEIFGLLAPYLLENPNDISLKNRLEDSLFDLSDVSGFSPKLNDQIFQTIKLQLTAHKLINIQYLQTTQGGYALFWSLTPKGQALMMELRTIRK
jgi:hypothetical protein